MFAEVVSWGLAVIVIGRFAADHLFFPVIATTKHLFFDKEGNEETHAMGFKLSPSDFSDEDEYDDEEMSMGFNLRKSHEG